MRLKSLILINLAFIVLISSACSSKDSPQASKSTNSITSVTDSAEIVTGTNNSITTADVLEYNGTFNEDVFIQMCQNIQIGNICISLPCIFDKMGKDFEIGEKPLLDSPNGILSSEILYKNSIVGYISLEYTDGDDEWVDNEILGYTFSWYDIKKLNYSDFFSVGGIGFQEQVEDVTSRLGTPSKISEYSNGERSYFYSVSINKQIRFTFDSSEKIVSISITNGK